MDRYLKGVLTIIAGALVYLCLVLTPWPRAAAQATPQLRPGDIAGGPIDVVVVGWRTPAGQVVPVAVQNAVSTTVQNTVQVAGRVSTERSSGAADRVVLVGWEERGDPASGGRDFRPFDSATATAPGLPTSVKTR